MKTITKNTIIRCGDTEYLPVEVDGVIYWYEDKQIPNAGYVKSICLAEIQSNIDYGVKLGDNQYISPFVNKVGECYGCRKIVAQSKPEIEGIPLITLNGYDYDQLGEFKINDALLAFESKHGYGLQTKEERDVKFKKIGFGGDYLYYSHYELDSVEGKVLLYYNEHTRHDCPYHVCLELPIKDLYYPLINNVNTIPTQYNKKDIELVYELSRKQHDTGMGSMSQGYTDMVYTHTIEEIFNLINQISTIQVDEQFNIISYE